ncbi:hypothetical protein [Burkholderia sp. S171]|uniref:hypothetical protein n=1 Tax=Burkholderia sp. S171 TaxID=1641860 RepID=UPI00131A7AB1|nr:hypothetical protein [Burkholderia sp. S171]
MTGSPFLLVAGNVMRAIDCAGHAGNTGLAHEKNRRLTGGRASTLRGPSPKDTAFYRAAADSVPTKAATPSAFRETLVRSAQSIARACRCYAGGQKRGHAMKIDGWQIPLATIAGVMGASAYFHHPAETSEAVAAWVQAVGSIGAILAAVWISNKQYRDTRELEARRAADESAKELTETVAFVEAIREELKSVWYGYSSDTRKQLLAVEEEDYLDHVYPVSADAFTIYNGASSRVGKVPDAKLRRLIVVIYAQAKGLISSFQANNVLIREFDSYDTGSMGAPQQMGSAIVKRRELVASTKKLKQRDAAIYRDLKAFRTCADKWLRSVGVESARPNPRTD